MSFKDLVTRIVDAVAIATEANDHERARLEQELIDDPALFVAEWGEYVPAELARALVPETEEEDEQA